MNNKKQFAVNRKAYHNFEILDKLEAGIVLTGCEVKSIRAGRLNLGDSFAKIMKDEVWLWNCHISAYFEGNINNTDPLRTRKLLFHKAQIKKLIGKVQEKGFALVPLEVYSQANRIKVLLALAKAKKMFDKRQSLKEKAISKDIAQESKIR